MGIGCRGLSPEAVSAAKNWGWKGKRQKRRWEREGNYLDPQHSPTHPLPCTRSCSVCPTRKTPAVPCNYSWLRLLAVSDQGKRGSRRATIMEHFGVKPGVKRGPWRDEHGLCGFVPLPQHLANTEAHKYQARTFPSWRKSTQSPPKAKKGSAEASTEPAPGRLRAPPTASVAKCPGLESFGSAKCPFLLNWILCQDQGSTPALL